VYFQWGPERLWERGGAVGYDYNVLFIMYTCYVTGGAVGSASCVAEGCAGDCRR